MIDQRALFEAAVVSRLKERGRLSLTPRGKVPTRKTLFPTASIASGGSNNG
jgi:hypothetical protein